MLWAVCGDQYINNARVVDPHESAQVLRVQVMRLGHSKIITVGRVHAAPMTKKTLLTWSAFRVYAGGVAALVGSRYAATLL